MKKFLSLFMLLSTSLLVYRHWLNFKLYSYGDYVYFTKETLLSYWPLSTWTSLFDIGGFDFVYWRMPQYLLYLIFAKMNLEFNVVDRFIVLWPWVFLSGLCVYVLLGKIVKSERAKVFGAFIFAYNTYFLSISSQGHLLISLASCFSIFSMWAFMKFLEHTKMRYVLIASIFLSLTTIYDLRIWYVTSFILGIYFLFNIWTGMKKINDVTHPVLGFLGIYIIYGLLNAFWILPTFLGGAGVGNGVLGRPLFGNEFLNVLYSYSLFHPFWTGAQPAWFEVQKIFVFSWMLPIFAILGFVVGRKNQFAIFFGIVACLGIFLTKQVSIPFSGVYEWLFYNFPGFNAFREASKFYYLIAIAYSVLIATLLNFLFQLRGHFSKYFGWGVIFIIGIVLIINIKPVFTGEIGSLMRERKLHNDYRILQRFINNQDEYFRVAWFPKAGWWRNATNLHPELSVSEMINGSWFKFRPRIPYELFQEGKISQAEYGIHFLSTTEGRRLLASSSVKYLILPVNEPGWPDNIYSFFGESKDEIYNSIKLIPYLTEKDIGTIELKVFEMQYYNPHLFISEERDMLNNEYYIASIAAQFKSSSHYNFKIHSTSEPFYLHFSEAYSPGWRLVLNDKTYEHKQEVDEIISQNNDIGINSFYINPQELCDQKKQCKKEVNGMYAMSFDLFFKPKFTLHFGNIVSAATWGFVCFLALAFLVKKIIKK